MPMMYTVLASFYDKLNASVDYDGIFHMIRDIFHENGIQKGATLLDLACGTGTLTVKFGEDGYDMIAVDLSEDMLMTARDNSDERELYPLYLCQDMRALDLYGTVDAAVCCLDTVNHLTEVGELAGCFELVHNYLIPDGVFVFDINTKHKFETLYAKEVYTYEDEDTFTVWENDYRPRSGLCDFYITQFRREADGRYVRTDEVQTERAYPLKTIQTTLKQCGFEFIGAYCDLKFTKGDENADRLYIVARAKKQNGRRKNDGK